MLLMSKNGFFLSAWDDRSVRLVETPDLWEKWQEVDAGNGKVELRTSRKNEYLCSWDEGDNRHYKVCLMEKEGGAEDWERWTKIKFRSGKVAYKSHHGRYLSAWDDGSLKLQPHCEGWEKWTVVHERETRHQDAFRQAALDREERLSQERIVRIEHSDFENIRVAPVCQREDMALRDVASLYWEVSDSNGCDSRKMIFGASQNINAISLFVGGTSSNTLSVSFSGSYQGGWDSRNQIGNALTEFYREQGVGPPKWDGLELVGTLRTWVRVRLLNGHGHEIGIVTMKIHVDVIEEKPDWADLADDLMHVAGLD